MGSMAPVWFRLGAELRTRWRALLGLALLVGIAAGAVIAAAAGARRTETAYDRFLRSQRAYDVAVFNAHAIHKFARFEPDAVAALPEVADLALGSVIGTALEGGTEGGLAARDGRIGRTVNRFAFLVGRAADPDRPDEATVGFEFAKRHHL